MTTSDPRPNPLRAWRKRHHVTQAQLAADLDVHYTVVSQWEQGRCIPTLARFSRIVKHTGLPVRPLLRFFVREPYEPNAGVVVQFPGRRKSLSRPDRS